MSVEADAPNAGSLPPGQIEGAAFVRFGLGRFLRRQIELPATPSLILGGDVARTADLAGDLARLPRVEQVSDFHCVTTWSRRNLRWGGVRFADFYHTLAQSIAAPLEGAELAVFQGLDGYRCAMNLADLLAGHDVLLADSLDGKPLGMEHGAPLRLVAPAHYGYKNVKHLCRIDFWRSRKHYRFPWPYPQLMDHPRARVALEERARFIPNALIRPLYRLFVPRAVRE